jgi:hypothetical protein
MHHRRNLPRSLQFGHCHLLLGFGNHHNRFLMCLFVLAFIRFKEAFFVLGHLQG